MSQDKFVAVSTIAVGQQPILKSIVDLLDVVL